jgi:hypothetical protein
MLPLGEIRFTTDGTEPSATSQLWAGAPITLTQTATIKASIFDHQTLISGPAEMTVNGPLMPAPEGLLLQPGFTGKFSMAQARPAGMDCPIYRV